VSRLLYLEDHTARNIAVTDYVNILDVKSVHRVPQDFVYHMVAGGAARSPVAIKEQEINFSVLHTGVESGVLLKDVRNLQWGVPIYAHLTVGDAGVQ